MTETLVHFSDAPLRSMLSTAQPSNRAFVKPVGLWVSVENEAQGWRSWCEAERFRLERLAFENHVTLAADARILRLGSAGAIDEFADDFRRPGEQRWSRMRIDWRRVAAAYRGIIIAPYCWSRRLHDGTSWYYGWDCASGCVWDADAIASVETRRAAVTTERAA